MQQNTDNLQHKEAVIVMTRVPEPGRTKTRMMPFLSAEQCAELHEHLLEDVRRTCSQVSADLFVCYTPAKSAERVRATFGPSASYLLQQGSDLGERMHHAVSDVLARGYDSCVLIGADAPELQPSDVEAAFEALGESDIVLGPARDGGYYLIGMRHPHAEVFDVREYGQDGVLEDTMRNASRLSLSCRTLRPLHDLDTPEDLYELLARSNVDKHTRSSATAGYLARMLDSKMGCTLGCVTLTYGRSA